MARTAPARYQEIAEYLRGVIADAEPGDRLPSESQLCERFSVSRMTARHAIQILEREHLLHRTRGRGTFVSTGPIPRLLGSPLSFTASMLRRGMEVTTEVLVAEYGTPSDGDVAALDIAPDDRVAVLERLRLADDVPMAIERAVLAPDCAELVEVVAGGSLHVAFEARGRIPSRATAEVTARLATARECDLLDLADSGVVLCERRVIYDQDDVALEHTETRYAADRYVFDVTMYRPASAPGSR